MIRISPVRVIGDDGQQLGVIPTEEALRRARELNLDLVEVAPQARPPVCRIMDYGKFRYQQSKKQGKSAHQAKTKELRLRPKTGDHDIETKVNHARKFLEHKDKVQISVIFRGREIAHEEEGRRVMERVVETLADVSRVEVPPKRAGRRIVCVLVPK